MTSAIFCTSSPFSAFFRMIATISAFPSALPLSIPSLNSIVPNLVIAIRSFTLLKSSTPKNLSASVYNTAYIFSSSVSVTEALEPCSSSMLLIILSPIFSRPDMSGVKSKGTRSSFPNGSPCFCFFSSPEIKLSAFLSFRRIIFTW